MLRISLARGRLLVGYGFNEKENQNLKGIDRGCRPSVFFAPHRDSLSLITRKLHTVLILKRKYIWDAFPSIVLMNFPSGGNVDMSQWKSATRIIKNHGIHFSWIDLIQTESNLLADADIYTQVFKLDLPEDITNIENNGDDPGKHVYTPPNMRYSSNDLNDFSITMESYVYEDGLRERFQLTGIEPADFDVFILHWYEPEIGLSSMLQTTTVDYDHSILYSYRGKTWFGVKGITLGRYAPVTFGECARLQNGCSVISRLSDILVSLATKEIILGFQYVRAQDKVMPLALSPKCTMAWGHTDGLIMWQWNSMVPFDLLYQFAESRSELIDKPKSTFVTDREKVENEDRAWLATKTSPPERLSSHTKDLYHRTLLILRQMQDPDGGIIAAPEFDFEFRRCGGYGFCWGRDAAFTTLAMDTCGMYAESASFYRYISRCQNRDGSFEQRHDMQANLAPIWGFQPDETGSILFGLWKHVQMAKDKQLAADLKEMTFKAANWLCDARLSGTELPIAGVDLWEERNGIHFYSLAAMIAGLNSAIEIYELMDWQVPAQWNERRVFLKNLINSERFVKGPDTFLARTLLRKIPEDTALIFLEQGEPIETHCGPGGRREYRLEADYVVDVSLLGAFFPFDVVVAKEQRIKFYEQLVKRIEANLWRQGKGGIGRYEGDSYQGGNPWILATLWLAIAAAKCGNKSLAKKCFAWSAEHASKEGLFAEQINPLTGRPIWVVPLTWSHAMFALALQLIPLEYLTE